MIEHIDHTECENGNEVTITTHITKSIGFDCGCCSSQEITIIKIECNKCDLLIEYHIKFYGGISYT